MASTNEVNLDEWAAKVQIKFRSDPRHACPSGIVKAQIGVTKSVGPMNIAPLDRFFEALKAERCNNGLYVGENFPVFIDSLVAVKVANSLHRGRRRQILEAAVKLNFCTTLTPNKSLDEVDLIITHTPEQHGKDVVDVLRALAHFAVYPELYEHADLYSEDDA